MAASSVLVAILRDGRAKARDLLRMTAVFVAGVGPTLSLLGGSPLRRL
jgi:hypothetical protein